MRLLVAICMLYSMLFYSLILNAPLGCYLYVVFHVVLSINSQCTSWLLFVCFIPCCFVHQFSMRLLVAICMLYSMLFYPLILNAPLGCYLYVVFHVVLSIDSQCTSLLLFVCCIPCCFIH